MNSSSLMSWITDAQYRASFNFWTSPETSLPYTFLIMVLSLFFFFLITGFAVDLTSIAPVLVIFPARVIEFDQRARVSADLSFAELTAVRRHHDISIDSQKAKPDSLDLFYRNGNTTTWSPLTPAADAILSAFQQWQMTRDA